MRRIKRADACPFALSVTFVHLQFSSSVEKLSYPKTAKVDHQDTYFGTVVPDPYRWLEDDNSPQTAKWVEEENKVTFGYLEMIAYRLKVNERLEKLYNYPKYASPFGGVTTSFSQKTMASRTGVCSTSRKGWTGRLKS